MLCLKPTTAIVVTLVGDLLCLLPFTDGLHRCHRKTCQYSRFSLYSALQAYLHCINRTLRSLFLYPRVRSFTCIESESSQSACALNTNLKSIGFLRLI